MAKKVKSTYQDVKEIAEKRGYKLLSKEKDIVNDKGFVLTETRILVKCPNPNHEPYSIRFLNFKRGDSCKECKYEEFRKKRTPYEEIKGYIESFDYELLSMEYEGCKKPLELKCPNGHTFSMRCDNFKQGQRCPHCYGNIKYTYEFVKEYVESFGYKLLSKNYSSAKEKISILCECGESWDVTFDHFKNHGSRCPHCKVSKGEEKIIKILKEYEIRYIHDTPYFKELIGIGGKPLRPDFILVDYKIWIEYDGEFHFKKYYKEQNYETLQIHDKLKNEYAKTNGWKLIRIPYWEFDNIEKILKEELNKINLQRLSKQYKNP